jgi:tryptophan synthase alpha chain
MSRLQNAFAACGRAAFIGYLVAGDPTPDASVAIACQMLACGVDILEIGIPFSDPVADGPTLQKANERALYAGATPETAFAMSRAIRRGSDAPLVLMTYANIVYHRGIDRFYAEARAAGVDGILIVDMPLEEAEPALTAARREEIDQIFLIAPTTSTPRIARIAAAATGYVYVISTPGVTGVRGHLPEGIADTLHAVRQHTSVPLAVGFGISTPEQVRLLCTAGADGIIIGSAFADIIERRQSQPEKMCGEVRHFTKTIQAAIPAHDSRKC